LDDRSFDTLARLIGATTRRAAVTALAAGALGLVLGLRDAEAGAAGCLNPGRSCSRGKQCCSGLCKGPKGRKRCRTAPGQSICTIRDDTCRTDINRDCGVGPLACRCWTTTAGRAFCSESGSTGVAGCERDADCVAAVGAGAACVRGGGDCAFETICLRPCQDPV
jgi:hypothetical protein